MRGMILSMIGLLALALLGATGKPPVGPPAVTGPEAMLQGKQFFEADCAPCHGLGGKGDGPIAANLLNKPRDLTLGVYKNRSTASGQLPTDLDIYRSITSGIHGSTMPGFTQMEPKTKWMLVTYLKSLSPRFSDGEEYPLDTVQISRPLPSTPTSLAEGRRIYLSMKCFDCHGEYGRGDGPAAPTQRDDAGRFVVSTDLTNRSAYKFSTSVTDIYRIFSTGLNGVPMPSYTNSLSDDERWHLANYVWALQNRDQYPAMGGARP